MKRLLSCAFALVTVFALTVPVLAISDSPPYSQVIVGNIADTKYIRYSSYDDVKSSEYTLTQRTIELYDVIDLWMKNGTSWAKTVQPFRNAFQAAGFKEYIQYDENNEEEYCYVSGVDYFIIYGEQASRDMMNESAIIYIEHDRAFYPSSTMTTQQVAEKLYAMGLFNGTGQDAEGNPIFELDRAPTRNEAVTMLVRLLGKNDEATQGTWSVPFTDVAEWAKPYVGYAYAHGLVSGTSATTYGGNDKITATQYITFVLRSLGYSSSTDFQWDKAWELSDQLGITDGQYNANTVNFTRGDVAVISYNSLLAEQKSTDYSYLAASDFRSVRRDYPSATAEIGYVYKYTDANGDTCVISIVQYKIISQYTDIVLHNLTKNTTTTDPKQYFKDLIDRSFGQDKLDAYDLYGEYLTNLQTAQKAMLSILQGGSNTASGTYVSAEYLNL